MTQKQLEDYLWGAANILRGMIDAADFKQYILSCFDGWQTSVTGEREVQKSLRQTLLKYKLHKEDGMFNRAYDYIKEYY